MQKWTDEIDRAICEDFAASQKVLWRNFVAGDSYAQQMSQMGYRFGTDPHSATFSECLLWLRSQPGATQFVPVKMFRNKETGAARSVDLFRALLPPPDTAPILKATVQEDSSRSSSRIVCVTDSTCDDLFSDSNYASANLLTPAEFVSLLSSGRFPIGDAVREHTNQTLAAHDIAHLAGFVSNPAYAFQIRRLFSAVGVQLKQNRRVQAALDHFTSLLSLRLYYLVEVLVIVKDTATLESALGFSVHEYPLDARNGESRAKIVARLSALDPVALANYMNALCRVFHSVVDPLGGESRDLYNRRRKHKRGQAQANASQLLYESASSKFAGNSLYSLYYSVQDALENERSSHASYATTIDRIYATFILALVGTAQLTVRDWIDGSIELEPTQDSRLFYYIDSMFSPSQLFWRAFCSKEYDTVV